MIKISFPRIFSSNLHHNSPSENCLIDKPKFISYTEYNFMLDTLSPAKDFGKNEWAQQFPFDLNQNSRILDLGADVGAYERIETEISN